MNANEPTPAARRHVRIRCQIEAKGLRLAGFSSNVSATGMQLLLSRDELGEAKLESGMVLGVSLRLPGAQRTSRLSGEIVWVNADDRDMDGALALGLGIRFVDVSDEVHKRLQQFVDGFRYAVMVVDDEPDNLEMMERALRDHYRIIACNSGHEALRKLEEEEVAVLVTDQRMPDMTGIELVLSVAKRLPYAHVVKVVLSAFEIQQARELINVGKIFQYLQKPIRPADLLLAVQHAADAYALQVEVSRLNAELERANHRLERENAYLRSRLGGMSAFESLLGSSPELRRALAELERIRRTEATVHIHGETGTGKELVARALHEGGPRASAPFVVHNCGGMTETLLQSTLFGHRKGAFTGADRDRPGVFRQAHEGTLFLDEVAELTPAVQASLLRVLQEGEVVPVGAATPERVDVRIISATHQDLHQAVEAGHFREDLYFRLVVIQVDLPPLRARRGDVAVLAQHFLERCCERYDKRLAGFTPRAMEVLEHYDWPGNIRELENVIERVVVLAETGRSVDLEHLPPGLAGRPPPAPHAAVDELLRNLSAVPGGQTGLEGGLVAALDHIERTLIDDALRGCDYNQRAAAKKLGVARQTLQSRIKRLGIKAT